MRATLVVIAVAGAVLASATQASARVACVRDRGPYTRTFCGPAKATLKIGHKTYSFKQGGRCAIDGSTWTLSIGTLTLSGKPKKTYFAITIFSKKAGTHGAAITWQIHGKSQSLYNAKVTLAKNLKKGTFKGSSGSGGKATGSFTCK